MRVVYFSLGWFFFALGIIGILLPVMPTTPFMLLALWAFSESSEKFHSWLYHHRLFGPPLQKWHEHRVIPLSAKIISVSFMSASLVYVFLYSTFPIWAKALAVTILVYGAWFVLVRPSNPPDTSNPTGTSKN